MLIRWSEVSGVFFPTPPGSTPPPGARFIGYGVANTPSDALLVALIGRLQADALDAEDWTIGGNVQR